MSANNETPPRLRHACPKAEELYQGGFCMIFWYPGRQDGPVGPEEGPGWRIVFADFNLWDQLEEVDDDPERRGAMVFTSDDATMYGEAQLVDVRFCPYCGENLKTPPTTRPF